MQAANPVAASARPRRPSRAATARGWVRDRLTTTPGRLVLVSILVAAGAVCFGAIATVAERSRAQAAQAVRVQTEPLLLKAATLDTQLSDANATATATFLQGGLETAAHRAHYLEDLRQASDSLSSLTREVGGSDARAAVATIAEQLPVYSGLVESARANNRQGFPVGASYLRQASGLLTGAILPQANRLYTNEASQLNRDYATGTAAGTLTVMVIAMVVAVLLLVVAQLYLLRVSRRIFNVPMTIATIVLVGVSIWAVIGLGGEQSSLSTAQRNGSDSVEVLSATAVLMSRAESDQSLTLVNRGSDQADPVDFKRVMPKLAGLVGEVQMLAQRTGTTAAASQLAADFRSYQSATNTLTTLETSGRIQDALNSSSSLDPVTQRLNNDLTGQIGAAQTRFTRAAADAGGSLSGLSFAIPLLTVLAGVLALLGLRQRLGEYR